MNKINFYLTGLTSKYIFINLIIVSIFIIFLNLIDISRIIVSEDKNIYDYIILSFLKLPSILNEILPFVSIIATSFLIRNLINNNELIALRNIGYSIFDIFIPIGFTVFLISLIFLIFLNPISANFENRYQEIIKQKDDGIYSIKISNNQMWIKNKIDQKISNFISIENIDLKDMKLSNIKILQINPESSYLIRAKNGIFDENILSLKDVQFYDLDDEIINNIESYNLDINFNKQNILNSITNYKFIPFYNYINHTNTLKKFNLYSSEVSLFYLSEILKPIFITILIFVVIGITGKFKRNENFFKVLFISILIGFVIFFTKEFITKITISFNINILISYLFILLIPFLYGLYHIVKIENE